MSYRTNTVVVMNSSVCDLLESKLRESSRRGMLAFCTTCSQCYVQLSWLMTDCKIGSQNRTDITTCQTVHVILTTFFIEYRIQQLMSLSRLALSFEQSNSFFKQLCTLPCTLLSFNFRAIGALIRSAPSILSILVLRKFIQSTYSLQNIQSAHRCHFLAWVRLNAQRPHIRVCYTYNAELYFAHSSSPLAPRISSAQQA